MPAETKTSTRPGMCRRADLLSHVKRGEVERATDRLLEETWTPAELDHQADGDGSALFWAALRGYTFLVELLLARGASVNDRSLASRGTPLHGAADNGRADVTRLLLQWGADVRTTNYFKDTPCHLAAYRGNAEIVSQLLRAGTDCTSRNARGNTVLDEAKAGQYMLAGGQHGLVQYLVTSHQAAAAGSLGRKEGAPHGDGGLAGVESGCRDGGGGVVPGRDVLDLRDFADGISIGDAAEKRDAMERRHAAERRDFSSGESRHCLTCKRSMHTAQTSR